MLPSERCEAVLECLRAADRPLTSREILKQCSIATDRMNDHAAIMYVRRTLAKLQEEGEVVCWIEPVIGTKHWRAVKL